MDVGNHGLSTKTEDIVINIPFTLTIEHAPLDLKGLFAVAQAFDLYEMAEDLSDHEGLVKDNILVDVLESKPTETVIKITLAQPMPYSIVAKHTDLMIKAITKSHLKGRSKVARLQWHLDTTGVASDVRGMLRKVS